MKVSIEVRQIADLLSCARPPLDSTLGTLKKSILPLIVLWSRYKSYVDRAGVVRG